MLNSTVDANATANILSLVHTMRENLDRIEAILSPVDSNKENDLSRLDPKSPLNKSDKFLTHRGIEVCYRLFDMGKTRYEVKELLNISYTASNHRFNTWEKAGGKNRKRMPIDGEDAKA